MSDIGSMLRPQSKAPEARGTVLFVDDEPVLREIASATLGRAGYDVLLAADGDDAGRVLEEASDRIGLVVLDWSMPGESGAALLERVRARCPSLHVVVSSGSIDEDVYTRRREDEALHVLPKPWRAQSLLALVSRLLG